MTTEQLRQNGLAMIALADGKAIQVRAGHQWIDCDLPDTCDWNLVHRPAPEPVVRGWSRPEDVPLNCWLQITVFGATEFLLVCSVLHGGVRIVGRNDVIQWSELCELWKYSTDRNTVHPCTVTEPAPVA